MSEKVLSKEQVAAWAIEAESDRLGQFDWLSRFVALSDSHEALRAERDAALADRDVMHGALCWIAWDTSGMPAPSTAPAGEVADAAIVEHKRVLAEVERLGEGVLAVEGDGIPWDSVATEYNYTGELVAKKIAAAKAEVERMRPVYDAAWRFTRARGIDGKLLAHLCATLEGCGPSASAQKEGK